MATSVVLGTRPDWTRSTLGIPIDTIVRVHPGTPGAKSDLAYSRNRVSVSRVAGATARPEDEYDVGFVYGPEATHQDIAARSLLPLLRKFVDGYNVAVMAFGSTGSGKTHLLEGSQGKERTSSAGNGLVHIAVDELFKLMTEKAVYVGTMLAEKRRSPSARAFDFFLETSFVELYREEVYDLYGKQQASRTPLQVYEDVTEGYQVSGLSHRVAKTAAELRTAFNSGRCMRDNTREDVGSVHDRAAAIFTIHLAQYSPASGPGEEDRILVSKIQFVDLPGSERLAEDPEILRLREGPILNRALHAFGATLRALAEGPGGGLAPAAAAAAAAAASAAAARYGGPDLTPSAAAATAGKSGGGGLSAAAAGSGVPFVNYEASPLTKLLADALGGNSLCLLAGTIRQADGSGGLQPLNTMQYLTIAGAVRNFPIINHGRSRGLIQKLRYRLMAVVEDRQALRDLLDSTSAEGDPNSMALHIAKLRDLEARLLAVRSENAELREEKQALQARLHKIHKAEAGDLQEKQEVQEALIQSEEQRLQLARALIDFQMEYNEARQDWETIKYELETKLIETEARQQEVVDEEVSRLENERAELEAMASDLTRQLAQELQLRLQLEEELEAGVSEPGEQEVVVRPVATEGGREVDVEEQAGLRTEEEPRASEAGAPEPDSGAENPLPPDGEEAENAEAAELDAEAETMKSPGGFSGKNFREKDRQIEALQSELQSTRQELESLRNGALGNQVSTDEVRETYRRKLQAMMRHLAALGLSMWEGDERGQEGADPRVTPEALFRALQSLADENIQVTEAREADMRHYADDAMARLVELRRKFKALYTAYRDLRCLVEDRWPGPDPRPPVPHEDEIVGGTLEGLIRSEEEADRRTINRLRDQVSQLQAQLESMRLSRGAQANVMGPQARPTDPGVRNTSPAGPATGAQRTLTEDVNGAGPTRGAGPTDLAATEAASTSPIAAANAYGEPPRSDPAITASLSDSDAVKPHQAGDATGSALTTHHLPANTSSSTGRVNTADDPRVSIASSPPPLGTAAPVNPHENSSRPGTPAALPQLSSGNPALAPSPTQAQTQSRPTEASSIPNTTLMSPMAQTALPPRSPPAAPLEPDGSFPASISPPAVLERDARSPLPPVTQELQSFPVELPRPPPPPPPPPPLLLLPEGGSLEPTDARPEGAVLEVGPNQEGPAEVVTRRTTDGSSPVQQQPLPFQVLPPPPSPLPAAAAHPLSSQSPVAQQQRLPPPLPPPPPPQLSLGAPGPGPRAAPELDPQLQVENQRLKDELGQLRRRLQAVSEFPAALELENQRLRDEVDSLVKKLQIAASAASDVSKAASVVAMQPNTASEGLIRQLREFNQKKTSELQRRVQQSETRAVMAEEQLEQLQGYMTKASGTYQKEIVRLRSIIGQMETSMGAVKGSYLNLSPLEGVGGGGTLRPAAAVLEEIATRSGSFTRRASAQGQTVMMITTPRETRSGGSSRTPLISAGGGVPGGVPASAANPGGGAAVSSKVDDGLIHLPAL